MFACGIYLLMIGYSVWSWVRKPRRFVAVGPEGIVLGDRPRRELQKYAWYRIRWVGVETPGSVLVGLEGGEIVWSLGNGCDAEARRCGEFVNQHYDLPE